MGKKGILVVSFGTSFPEVMKENIVPVEESIKVSYPEYIVRRAFTSKMIIKKLRERDGIKIDDLEEALFRFRDEGFSEIIIQPTLFIHGTEYDIITENVREFSKYFDSIKVGNPLLHSHEDYCRVIEGLEKLMAFNEKDTAFVLMGHGTEHFANACYPAFQQYLTYAGHANVFIGTVEGYPDLDYVRKCLKQEGYKKVVLAPFMLVAGDHAKNDMAGDDNSWKTILEEDGLLVDCILKGLGSYEFTRQIFVEHVGMT